jgi:putative transposase
VHLRRRAYIARDEARLHIFDYIEMFSNLKRRHSFSNNILPVEFETQYFQRLSSV